MTDTTDNTLDAAKHRALEELEAYRQRKRSAAVTAEAPEVELEREILSLREQKERQRQAEAEQARTRQAHARLLEEFQARRDAVSAAERAGRAAGDFRQGPVGLPPARRVVRLLRDRLGDDFQALVVDIKACDFRQFQIEVARLPHDEQAERLYREREAQAAAMAAAAKTLPEPEDATEAAILAKHGFVPDSRALELDGTVA